MPQLRTPGQAARTRRGRARQLSYALAAGRLGLGASFLAAPRLSVSILGVDSVTAERMTFLARMTAARDLALAIGALGELVAGRTAAGWILAGAACDAADALAIGVAAKAGRLDPARAGAMAILATGAAGVGGWAARG